MGRVPQHATGAHEQGDLAEVLAGALDDTAVRAHHHVRPTGVAAQREDRGSRGDLLVLVASAEVVGKKDGSEARSSAAGSRSEGSSAASHVLSALHRMPRSPSTVRVTGVVATTSRESRRPPDRAVRRSARRRRSPDVDHHDIGPRLRREHLDPGEHEIGVAPRTIAVKSARELSPFRRSRARGTSRGWRGAPARERVRRSAAPRCP